jgi:hypothetical protein
VFARVLRAASGGGGVTWVRLDDRFADHPKNAALSDAAFRAQIEAICYCAGALTDGKIARGIARRWNAKAIAELVRNGSWIKTPAGYEIHDYLNYQKTKQAVLLERERRARAGSENGRKGHAHLRHLQAVEPEQTA